MSKFLINIFGFFLNIRLKKLKTYRSLKDNDRAFIYKITKDNLKSKLISDVASINVIIDHSNLNPEVEVSFYIKKQHLIFVYQYY